MKKNKQSNPEDYLSAEDYVKFKKRQYKAKQVQEQIKQNNKSLLGFGYNYQEIRHENK